MSSAYKIVPIVPDECVGKEPSLNMLREYVAEDIITFPPEILGVLDEYIKVSKWANGSYYLYGQLMTRPDEPITRKKLTDAIDENNRRHLEYGGPCNMLEQLSIMSSEKNFHDLLKILEMYYDEISYRPGGSGYKQSMASFAQRNQK